MQNSYEKISSFINEHHVMSLATTLDKDISVCSLFYVFDKKQSTFIIISDDSTKHISHIKLNSKVAGNILLETENVGEIKGVQFYGEFMELSNKNLRDTYTDRFPYALIGDSKFWQIKLNKMKMTDNSMGFGKKLIWP